MPFQSWPCLPDPRWGAGACHVGLCGSDIRSRVKQHTRERRLNTRDHSRFNSNQLNSIVALPVAALYRLKPANAYVSGVHDQHFTCQRTQTTLVAGGSAMVQRSASTSRGLMASPAGIFADLIMGNHAVMNHQKCDRARRSLRARSRNLSCFQGIYGYLPVPGLLPPPAPPLPGPLGLSPLFPGASLASLPAGAAASAWARNFNRSGAS